MEPSRQGGRVLLVLGALLVLASAVATHRFAAGDREQERRDRLQEIADREARQIGGDLERWADLLATAGALDVGGLDERAFTAFVDDAFGDRDATGTLTGTYRGMGSVVWVEPEPSAGAAPAYVVRYARPDPLAAEVVGADLNALPQRGPGLEQARDSGRPAVVGFFVPLSELDLPADEQSQLGSLYVPIYRGDGVPSTVAGRQMTHAGWMVTGFRADDLLHGVLQDERLGAALLVDDELVHSTSADLDGRASATAAIDAFGQRWSLMVTAVEPIVGGSWLDTALAVAGLEAALGLSLLVVIELLLRWRRSDRRRIAAVEERAVAWREARQDLADRVAVGVLDLGPDGELRYVSSSVQDLLGRTPAELTGRTLQAVLDDVGAGTDAQLLLDRAASASDRAELELPSGRRTRFTASAMPEGGTMLTIVDVTADRAAIDELSDALDEAVEQREQGRRLLATMSHEVRTPLAGIVGLSSVALEETDPGLPVHDVLRQVQDVGVDLLEIVNDALAISISDEGTLRLSPGPVDARRFLDELLAQHRPNVATGVELRGSVHAVDVVRTDSSRLRQIVGNLVANAARHTADGTIDVAIDRTAAGMLRIVVNDTGCGISPEAQAQVFEPFWQVDGSAHRSGGAGLGLAVVRSLVDAMDGTVELRSAEGVGTRFVVELPAPDTEAPGTVEDTPLAETRPTPALGLRVIVVDDDAISGEVASRQLGRLGARVEVIDDGLRALREMRSTTADITVIDLHLPGVDGFAILEAALERREAATVPKLVIAATASSAPEDHRRCRELGVDAVMLKPLDRGVLGDLISSRWPELAAARLPNGPSLLVVNEGRITELEELGVLDGIIELAAEQVPELRRQVADPDGEVRANGAHRLAGTLFALGADRLADEANALQRAVRDEPDAVVRARLDRLFGSSEELLARLASERAGSTVSGASIE